MRYAHPFKRLAAFLIDLLILMALYISLGLILSKPPFFDQLMALPVLGLWWVSGMIGTAWLYYASLESSPLQATLGKKILRLKVRHVERGRISFWRASARHFAKILLRLPPFIGLFMVFFTKKRQALHDKIASTVVVDA